MSETQVFHSGYIVNMFTSYKEDSAGLEEPYIRIGYFVNDNSQLKDLDINPQNGYFASITDTLIKL